ncbi:MAG: serine/threonine-protein kinase [Candidatus Sumerlaeia bacterium]|nr:serine/threonine-protein kinase [Candidatus Sumerlaeia bacterium]
MPENTAEAVAALHDVKTDFDVIPLADIPNYQIGRELGRGGMSVVYSAICEKTREKVAIKILYPYYASNTDLVKRLQREIEVLRRVQHPNIVRYLDSGQRRSCCYYVMEFLQGESLEQRIEREHRLPEKEAVRIIRAVANGLAEAHRHAVFHRDVKPGNIFLANDGQIKLMDFGLAKDQTDAYQTQMGLVIGTPLYLAPEQARGEQNIDGRADIYALGITLYHCLTGHIPFENLSVPLILTKKTVTAIPSPKEWVPDLSDNIVEIIAGMCERDVSLRYPDVEILIEDLERHLNNQPAMWGRKVAQRRTTTGLPPQPVVTSSILGDPVLRSVIMDSSGLTETLHFPADHVLFFEGDTSKEVYLLVSGEVEALKAGIRIAVLNKPGTFFGEMSSLLGLPRSTTIRTRTDVQVIRIDHETFASFLKTFPNLNYQLAVMLAERLQKTTEDYYELRNRFRSLARHFSIVNSLLREPEKE